MTIYKKYCIFYKRNAIYSFGLGITECPVSFWTFDYRNESLRLRHIISTSDNRIHHHQRTRARQTSLGLLEQFLKASPEQGHFLQCRNSATSSNSWWRSGLAVIYNDGAKKWTPVCYRISEVQWVYEGMFDSLWSGQFPELGIDEILTDRRERDPHAIARKLTCSLSVSPQTIATH
jgi:hypothetical protein